MFESVLVTGIIYLVLAAVGVGVATWWGYFIKVGATETYIK